MCIVCAFYNKKQTLIYDSKMVNKVKRKKFELSSCVKKVCKTIPWRKTQFKMTQQKISQSEYHVYLISLFGQNFTFELY